MDHSAGAHGPHSRQGPQGRHTQTTGQVHVDYRAVKHRPQSRQTWTTEQVRLQGTETKEGEAMQERPQPAAQLQYHV